MPYSEELAERVRAVIHALDEAETIAEKKMFGGLCFLHHGNMCCGVEKDRLMIRCGKEAYEAALGAPHCQEMDFTGRPMKGMVIIESAGLETQEDIQHWIRLGLAFTSTLPPK